MPKDKQWPPPSGLTETAMAAFETGLRDSGPPGWLLDGVAWLESTVIIELSTDHEPAAAAVAAVEAELLQRLQRACEDPEYEIPCRLQHHETNGRRAKFIGKVIASVWD